VSTSDGTKSVRSQRSRAAILSAARQRFTVDGFERTTVRAVAADAHIDPSMVLRYFGSKDGLFAAAADLDLALPDLSQVPHDQLGAAAVGHFLSRWEDNPAGDALRLLLATAVTSAPAAARMQEIFRDQLQPVVAAAGHYDSTAAAQRAGLVATQILGLALCRYVLRLPPVVDLDRDTILYWLAPVIQRYLTEPGTEVPPGPA
jgi:AcrR family transcriptional regulator